ncbi:MAG TPA: hypothetical protein VNZ52_05480 [Candidatus Thermoplasmatota archaeon]|nr:hypothetical protein [Candidatus Thermoplasmatota archaeon]
MRGHRFWSVGAGALALLLAVTPVVAQVFDPALRGPVHRHVYLHDGTLTDAVVRGGFLDEMQLERVHASDADLRNTTLREGSLKDVTLENVHLEKVAVQGFRMVGGSAVDTTLERGRVKGVALERVRLCQVYVEDTATYYDATCAPLRAAPGAGALPERRYEREPIEVRADHDLCDNVSLYQAEDGSVDGVDDDGVINCLTANGSPESPFRISGWVLTTEGTSATAAIRLHGLRSHVVLDNLRVEAPGVTGLRVEDSRNLRVAPDVVITGARLGYDVQGTHLSLLGGQIREAGNGARFTSSLGLTVDGLDVAADGTCLSFVATAAAVKGVTATGCRSAFHLSGGPVSLTGSRTFRVGVAVELDHAERGTVVAHNRFLAVTAAVSVMGDASRVLFHGNHVDAPVPLAAGSQSEPQWRAPTAQSGLDVLGGSGLSGNQWVQAAPMADRAGLTPG